MIETTHGWLLDHRVRYTQPRVGFRTGIEPVLLAAAVPAAAGERVLEAGTGAGAGLLCLAHRVPGVEGLGVERESCLAAIANENFAANDDDAMRAITGDIATIRTDRVFDHAFTNPPWHGTSGTTASNVLRARAKQGADLGGWVAALASVLRPHGSITLILPATSLGQALRALEQACCGNVAILPLWPKRGRAAKIILLQARRAGRGPLRLLAGLTLHRDDGAFTEDADAVLRGGTGIALDRDAIAVGRLDSLATGLAFGVPEVP